jgi:membrane protease YdiL (CAAX protease family)
MSETQPRAHGGDLPPPTVASSEVLRLEAVSLGGILLATLLVASLERKDIIPSAGYLSALVLLAASWWHKRRFGIPVRFVLQPGEPWSYPAILAVVATASLALTATSPFHSEIKSELSALQSLNILILVPLSEELYFRGLLFDHLRRGFNAISATLLCTLLFAALHYPYSAMTTAGILSLVACTLVIRTGSLACALQLHLAWNAMSEIHGLASPAARWTLAIIASATTIAIAAARTKAHPKRET